MQTHATPHTHAGYEKLWAWRRKLERPGEEGRKRKRRKGAGDGEGEGAGGCGGGDGGVDSSSGGGLVVMETVAVVVA